MPVIAFVSRQTRAAIACAMISGLCGTVSAQDALGTGNALDANTGQSGRVNSQRQSFTNELSFRNSIATGNAPGGLSFRGDLGYRAVGEFSGELGSDTLFAFRRDSLYSGLAGMGIRGTDAIQYQFALTTGAAPPRNLMGNLSVARDSYYNPTQFAPGLSSGSSSRNSTMNSATGSGIGFDPEAMALDPRGKQLSGSGTGYSGYEGSLGLDSSSMVGSLRSASTYSTTSSLQPALISLFEVGIDRQQIGLVASPLLGITSTPMASDTPAEPNPLVARPANAGTDSGAPGGLSTTKRVTSYDELVTQMRTHVETMRTLNAQSGQSTIDPNESNDSWLIRQMQDLREKLYGVKPANDDDPKANDPYGINPTDPADPASSTDSDDPSQSQTPEVFDPTNDPESPLSKMLEESLRGVSSSLTGVELYDPTVMSIDPETLEVLRGAAAKRVDRLLDPGADKRDLYGEHMVAGQRLISQGRYFDAEERFTHALSLRPGDIPAQLGRFHAQIGAGMVLSASVNLQALFSMHPELIASRYSGNLLPDPERMGLLIIRLKERAGIIKPELSIRVMESEQIQVSAGLLLAYLGYQANDQEALVSGLAKVTEVGADIDRRFASLLTQLWIIDPQLDSTGAPGSD